MLAFFHGYCLAAIAHPKPDSVRLRKTSEHLHTDVADGLTSEPLWLLSFPKLGVIFVYQLCVVVDAWP